MSAAAATAEPAAAPAKGGRKKKLVLLLSAGVALLVVIGAVAAVLVAKQRAAADDDSADADGAPAAIQTAARDPKHPPTFVPLDAFTVNLADKESDRYAQIGVTLEVADASTADAIKVFMPAIRNNILLVLSHKNAAELLDREGKTRLAQEIRRETARGLGLAVDNGAPADTLPVAAVYFSTFIIQ
jgi:flagellar FliL protein